MTFLLSLWISFVVSSYKAFVNWQPETGPVQGGASLEAKGWIHEVLCYGGVHIRTQLLYYVMSLGRNDLIEFRLER